MLVDQSLVLIDNTLDTPISQAVEVPETCAFSGNLSLAATYDTTTTAVGTAVVLTVNSDDNATPATTVATLNGVVGADGVVNFPLPYKLGKYISVTASPEAKAVVLTMGRQAWEAKAQAESISSEPVVEQAE